MPVRRESMRLPTLVSVFLLSGTAGLLYQVVWVREFGLIFGNTIHSAALVTGVFMAGLGVGGWLGGVVADRAHARDRRSGIRLYVCAEAGIALLGMAIAFILPRLEAISAAVSTYRVSGSGWQVPSPGSYLLRYAIAVLLLGPITLLMGSSLTFLVRAVVQGDLSRAGLRVGLLYGFNTLGAALG